MGDQGGPGGTGSRELRDIRRGSSFDRLDLLIQPQKHEFPAPFGTDSYRTSFYSHDIPPLASCSGSRVAEFLSSPRFHRQNPGRISSVEVSGTSELDWLYSSPIAPFRTGFGAEWNLGMEMIRNVWKCFSQSAEVAD